MSAFDDEFGLFGEESESDESERRPTLGARKIVANETVIDEIEPEDDQPRRTARPDRGVRRERTGGGSRRNDDRSADPWAGHRRGTELLGFLARKLVGDAEKVNVELFVDEQAQPVIELIVAPDDLGRVIGRSGRVAHALRTIVRATAEGRVAIDILDSEEAAEPIDGDAADA